MDGLTMFLIAVVVLSVVLLVVLVNDVPDQIHNPVEFTGGWRVLKVAAAVAVVGWVIGMLLH